MRKLPGSPSSTNPNVNENVVTQIREYELITPLFGGGVRPKEADPVTMIRGSEIRGNLRFWWRASRGGQFSDLASMKDAEDKLWGKAHKKNEQGLPLDKMVQIVVKKISSSSSTRLYKIEQDDRGRNQLKVAEPRFNRITYAAFPLQPDQEELKKILPEIAVVQENVSFRLLISFPESSRIDIEASLWAWETFGGIGGRTRRGFGSLRCISIKENDPIVPLDLPEANPEKAMQWLQKKAQEFVADGPWPKNVPHLTKHYTDGKNTKLVTRNDKHSVFDVWGTLIERLKTFRQVRFASVQPRANHPGRSMWSEPDTIRHLTNQTDPRHTNPKPNPSVNKFPRAAFGLPIIFQFKDSNKRFPDDKTNDPRKTLLKLQSYERLASPLILKPLSCQGGEFLGLASILERTKLKEGDLLLESQEGTLQHWNVVESFSPHETLNFAVQNQQVKIDKQTDALQAFINYL